MHSTKTVYKQLPRTLRTPSTTLKISRPITTTAKMSFFPRSYFAPESSFTPLFRLLDDYDNYSREVTQQGQGQGQGQRQTGRRAASLPAFTPKFDVKELENSYELHGELPGIEKNNVNIEFTDDSTIVISGRVERHYTSGTPPNEDGSVQMSGAITEGDKEHNNSHKATVEDEDAERAKQQGTSTEVTKTNKQQEVSRPADRFWVSERSVGSFHRTFSFPSRIDQEHVTANLNNGVLSITVPKIKKQEGRRIAIQ
ncbi:HSP20-like chaperone [Diaporthe sp. PMI_573]|nr:HSP20-like chaperone [Diaporthaceae sp. PMI_573]